MWCKEIFGVFISTATMKLALGIAYLTFITGSEIVTERSQYILFPRGDISGQSNDRTLQTAQSREPCFLRCGYQVYNNTKYDNKYNNNLIIRFDKLSG